MEKFNSPLKDERDCNSRVVIAMSGGVDSSVAAALLKKQGFDVVGIFMQLWTPMCFDKIENKCCNVEALEGARRVAAKLEIPLYTINFSKEFKKYIVDYFIREYSLCRTPNPCVICNKFIKFNFLLKKAKELEADYLATGHYVRIAHGPRNRKLKLLIGADEQKDQSYFLWTLTQSQLKHLLFPVGSYTKEKVRYMAKKWQLPTAERKESQGLCFIGYWKNREFLKKFIKPTAGPIKDLEGNILGQHTGLPFYTIGQRKGVEINIKTPNTPPFYVVKFDVQDNALIVSKEKDLYKKELYAKRVNWINKPYNLDKGFKCKAKIRYGHPAMPCEIFQSCIKNRKLKVVFEKPVRAITPGQSVVFYKNQELLGGGIIEN